jgi:erythronate-4-phosphate dehydrogenase
MQMKIIADENIPFVQQCFSLLGEVEVLPARKITPHSVRDVDVLLVRSVTEVNAKLLSASRVRFVGTATIGFEHVDVEYLRKNNIAFVSAPGSNANSVAEYVIAALLSVGNKHKIELEGKSIAVIGAGNCGSRVAQKCAALGMKIFLNDPPLQRRTNDPKYLPIEEIFDCDFITFHTPLTVEEPDGTFHLADQKFFKSLRTGCVFINTSRGGVVETAALKGIIRSGKLEAVVLDVWENEPNINTELLRMVDIGTPHIAGYSLDGKIAGMIMIYRAACEHFGLKPEFNAASFSPAPTVGEIRIDSVDAGKEQDIIHQTVQQVYAINRDDFNTREILMVPEANRGRFFDDLRKNYPVRREFHNTRVLVKDENSRLARKLKGIGFLYGKK